MGLLNLRDMLGTVRLVAWFEEGGDGPSLGMGAAVHTARDGSVEKVVIAPTGVRMEVAA